MQTWNIKAVQLATKNRRQCWKKNHENFMTRFRSKFGDIFVNFGKSLAPFFNRSVIRLGHGSPLEADKVRHCEFLYWTFICVTYFGVPSPGNCMYILIGNIALPGSDVLYLAPRYSHQRYATRQRNSFQRSVISLLSKSWITKTCYHRKEQSVSGNWAHD